MAGESRYSYHPLQDNEIRILHLFPGKRNAPLHGMLEHVQLPHANETEYEAISYAWGSQDQPREINLDGDSYLKMTSSLYEVLKQFRYSDKSRALWADALCINQNDLSERSSQVAIMADIFRASTRVLVWLGTADRDDAMAFATITACASIPEDQQNGDSAHYEIIKAKLASNTGMKNTQMQSMGLYSFGLLLHRSWFSRLWVNEEVTLGRSVRLCSGRYFTSWEKFISCSFQLRDLRRTVLADDVYIRNLDRDWLNLACETMAQIEVRRRMEESDFGAAGFLTAMHNFSNRRCQDPHDRIYALRRFLGLHNVEPLRPDYSLSPKEIYQRAIEVYLAATQTSSGAVPHASLLFGLVGTEMSEDISTTTGLGKPPSWVPDFQNLSERSRCKYDRYCLPHLAQFHWKDQGIQRRTPPATTVTWQMTVGQVFGKVICVLPSTSCPRERSNSDVNGLSFRQELLPRLILWFKTCASILDVWPAPLQGHLGKGMDEVLSCDDTATGDGLECEPFEKLVGAEFRGHERRWVYESLRPFLAFDPHPRHDSGRILSFIRIKQTLTFGWVPPSVRSGDYVAVFAGAPYAFALRRAEPRTWYYLLGDVHISGLSARIHVDESNFGSQIRIEAKRARNMNMNRVIASERDQLSETQREEVAIRDDLKGKWGWITLL